MVRYELPLVKPWWLPQITSLPSMYFYMSSHRKFHEFSEHWGETDLSVLSRVILYLRFINGSNIPFLQSLETWLDYHDFSNIMKNGLAAALANSLRILGGISLGPIDLCPFRFLRWFQIQSFSQWHSPASCSLIYMVCPIPDKESSTCPC